MDQTISSFLLEQQNFYEKVFSLQLDFSQLENGKLPTKLNGGIMFFNTDKLEDDHLQAVADDILGIRNNRPDISQTARVVNEVRDKEYFVSLSDCPNDFFLRQNYLTYRERQILEIFLKTQRNNQSLHDYFNKVFVCKGTIYFYQDKKYYPYLSRDERGNRGIRYYCNYVNSVTIDYCSNRFFVNNKIRVF